MLDQTPLPFIGPQTFWNPCELSALGWMLEAHAPSHLFTATLASHVRTRTEFWSYSSGKMRHWWINWQVFWNSHSMLLHYVGPIPRLDFFILLGNASSSNFNRNGCISILLPFTWEERKHLDVGGIISGWASITNSCSIQFTMACRALIKIL